MGRDRRDKLIHQPPEPSRRLFLRGVGASLALPFLHSALPRRAWSSDPTPPKRLLYYYVPNGFNMDQFRPTGEGSGKNWSLSPILEPLSDWKEQLLVVSGVDNAPGNYRPGEDASGGAHFQQTASFLTCRHIDKAPFGAGQSIDQVAAEALGYVTPHRSLQLGMRTNINGGNCGGSEWPCQYLTYISWAAPTVPMALRSDPAGLFQILFGTGEGVAEEEFEARRAQRLRVLDVVREDASRLHSRLGSYDKLKLDQYLTAVHETESAVMAEQWGQSCEPGAPPLPGGSYTEKLEQMLDVMVLAFQCDLTRIQTFMTYSGGNTHSLVYDWLSYEGSPLQQVFHDYSHHGGDPTNLGKIAAINTWEVEVFAGLLARLEAVEEADGSRLLDNTITFFSSEISDGDAHSASDLPIVIAGGGQGTLRTDAHLVYQAPDNVYADLHIALLEAFGVSVDSFGDDGTGVLPGLLL